VTQTRVHFATPTGQATGRIVSQTAKSGYPFESSEHLCRAAVKSVRTLGLVKV